MSGRARKDRRILGAVATAARWSAVAALLALVASGAITCAKRNPWQADSFCYFLEEGRTNVARAVLTVVVDSLTTDLEKVGPSVCLERVISWVDAQPCIDKTHRDMTLRSLPPIAVVRLYLQRGRMTKEFVAYIKFGPSGIRVLSLRQEHWPGQ